MSLLAKPMRTQEQNLPSWGDDLVIFPERQYSYVPPTVRIGGYLISSQFTRCCPRRHERNLRGVEAGARKSWIRATYGLNPPASIFGGFGTMPSS